MDFLKVLKDNDEKEIKEYLYQYGKAPKPAAPFYFVLDKEASNNGRNTTVNAGIDETNPGNNCETEVTE